jgi:hypothetical protein
VIPDAARAAVRGHLRAADQALAEYHRNPTSPAALAVATAQIEAATLTIRLARVPS